MKKPASTAFSAKEDCLIDQKFKGKNHENGYCDAPCNKNNTGYPFSGGKESGF
jgi:hypothetical protein